MNTAMLSKLSVSSRTAMKFEIHTGGSAGRACRHVLFGNARYPRWLRTAGAGGELEAEKKSDGGLCEVSHFVEV